MKKTQKSSNQGQKKQRAIYAIKKAGRKFVMVGVLSVISLMAFAQQAPVTISKQNVKLVEVLNAIESQTNYLFVYKNDVNVNVLVSVNADKQPVAQVLKTLLKDRNISYTLSGNHITLTPVSAAPVTQLKRITGVVRDEKGEPISGASITGIGNAHRGATAIDGRFVMNVLPFAQLKISFIGFRDYVLTVGADNNYNIVLLEDTQFLKDVVITGYQKMDKRDMVGAYTTVKVQDIYMPNYSTIDKMLQGVVPGMIVTSNSSRVGTSPSIQIRGTSTFLGNTQPLWVIDGIIQEDPIEINASNFMSEDMKNIIGNQVSWLNPQDIETITVLKDASATAIYGSKASNGVIVVTTKMGKMGDKTTVNYSASATVNTQPNYGMFNLMNSQERLRFSDEMFSSGVPYVSVPFKDDYTYEGTKRKFIEQDITEAQFSAKRQFLETANTNWLDLLTRTGIDQNHNLSFSGGANKMSFIASLGYTKQQGQEIGNDANRMTGRVAVRFDISPKLQLNLSITGGYTKNYGFGTGVNPMQYALKTSRAIPAFDENGNPAYYQKSNGYPQNKLNTTLGYNFVNERDNSNAITETMKMAANADLSYKVLPWLTYNFTGGYNYNSNFMSSYMADKTYYIAYNYRGYDYNTEITGSDYFKAAQLPFGGEYFTNDAHQNAYNLQNKFAMAWNLPKKSRLNVLLAQELRSGTNISTANTVWGYSKERGEAVILPTLPVELVPIGTAASAYSGYGILTGLYNNKWKRLNATNNFVSVFATAAYSFNNRYVLNASVRNDFSNRFGQDVNKRLDPTYSLGASWRVAEEQFVKKHLPQLNQFTLRATYGIQGNALANQTPELILNRQGLLGVFKEYYSTIAKIPNPYLSWERTTNWNFGADITVFRNINATFDYYQRRSNAIISQDIPLEFGIGTSNANGGIVYNKGVEGTLAFSPINNATTGFSISLNASRNWNKTGRMVGPKATLNYYLNGRSDAIVKEGYPVNAFWSYSFAGLNPTNGAPLFNLIDYNRVDKATALADPSSFLVYSGVTAPTVTGGLNLNFRYKSLSVGMGFAMLLGGKTRLDNPYSNFGGNSGGNNRLAESYYNVDRRLLNRWQNPGDELTTNIPALNPLAGLVYLPNEATPGYPVDWWAMSDAMVVDASFLRCRNLDLTWRFNQHTLNKLGMKNLALTYTMNNLFVVASKRFEGMDPELKNSVTPKAFSLGLSCSF